MSLYELLTSGGIGLFVLLTLIEFTPIKINPWGAIAKIIGRAINGELIGKVEKLQQTIDEVKESNKHLDNKYDKLQDTINEVKENHNRFEDKYNKDEATECRIRIIRFSDEILHHMDHSKENFDQVLDDISFYTNYCQTHPEFKNGKAVFAIQNIQRKNQECFDNDSYL